MLGLLQYFSMHNYLLLFYFPTSCLGVILRQLKTFAVEQYIKTESFFKTHSTLMRKVVSNKKELSQTSLCHLINKFKHVVVQNQNAKRVTDHSRKLQNAKLDETIRLVVDALIENPNFILRKRSSDS